VVPPGWDDEAAVVAVPLWQQAHPTAGEVSETAPAGQRGLDVDGPVVQVPSIGRRLVPRHRALLPSVAADRQLQAAPLTQAASGVIDNRAQSALV